MHNFSGCPGHFFLAIQSSLRSSFSRTGRMDKTRNATPFSVIPKRANASHVQDYGTIFWCTAIDMCAPKISASKTIESGDLLCLLLWNSRHSFDSNWKFILNLRRTQRFLQISSNRLKVHLLSLVFCCQLLGPRLVSQTEQRDKPRGSTVSSDHFHCQWSKGRRDEVLSHMINIQGRPLDPSMLCEPLNHLHWLL